MKKTFGKILTDALESENMTRKELAAKLSLTVSTISYYCTDKRIPPYPIMVSICQFFRLNLNDVYQIPTKELSNKDINLLHRYKMLSDDEKDVINKLLDLLSEKK